MKQSQDNPNIKITLTADQIRQIRDWSDCLVSTVVVLAYPDSSSQADKGARSIRNSIPIKLEPDQVKTITDHFSEHNVTGDEIVVFDPHDEEEGETSVTAFAVLRKKKSLANVSGTDSSSGTDVEYNRSDTCCSCGDY